MTDFSSVTERLETAVAKGEVPGIGLVIIQEGEVLYERAFGDATVETVSGLASATKLASATTMMNLLDDGLIVLDNSIVKYLPNFLDEKGAVTIRQLLAQTHGLPFAHSSIPLPQVDNHLTLAESVDQIARDSKLVRPPGTKFEYSPAASYAILGRIAEVVTGQPWGELFEQRIAGPLEMKTFSYGPGLNPRIGGGAVAALADYRNMLRMFLDQGIFAGKRVLSAKAIAEMWSGQLNGLPFLPLESYPTSGYGLAWWFEQLDTAGKAVQMSVPGLSGAHPWVNLSLNYGGFLLPTRVPPAELAQAPNPATVVQQAFVRRMKLNGEVIALVNAALKS